MKWLCYLIKSEQSHITKLNRSQLLQSSICIALDADRQQLSKWIINSQYHIMQRHLKSMKYWLILHKKGKQSNEWKTVTFLCISVHLFRWHLYGYFILCKLYHYWNLSIVHWIITLLLVYLDEPLVSLDFFIYHYSYLLLFRVSQMESQLFRTRTISKLCIFVVL